jgi:ELWxxDGT repeat protein
LNGYYYFGAFENSRNGLWRSDGTEGGTTKVYDYGVETYSDLNPEYFFETNTDLYFVANRTELWKTDGTSNGIIQVPNYSLDNETLSPSVHLILYPEIFKNSANQLLWKGWDVQNGFELWKSNSSIENSTLLSNITTRTNQSSASDVKCKINGIWFFNGVNDNTFAKFKYE